MNELQKRQARCRERVLEIADMQQQATPAELRQAIVDMAEALNRLWTDTDRIVSDYNPKIARANGFSGIPF